MSRRDPKDRSDRRTPPQPIGDLIAGFLDEKGLAKRVDQAGIIPNWAKLVGPQIAQVTTPQSISANGTLLVHVTTNAWMTELSLLEPELLKSLNGDPKRPPVRRIRWLLAR